MNNRNIKKQFPMASDLLNLEIEKCIEDSLEREIFFNKHNRLGEHRLNGRKVKLIQMSLREE